MSAYWITWVSFVVFALMAKRFDYLTIDEICDGCYHHSLSERIILFTGGAILSFVAGFRFYVGADFSNYYNFYHKIASSAAESILSFDEPILPIIYRITIQFIDSPQACIFVAAAVTTLLGIHSMNKYSKNPSFSAILYAFVVWHTCFNGVRQALAVSFLLLGYPYLKQKRFWKYALCVLVAFLCHASALPMILVYFVVQREYKPRNIIFIIIGTIIALLSYEYIFKFTGWLLNAKQFYDANETNYWTGGVNILRILFEVFPLFLFSLVFRHREKNTAVIEDLYLLLTHAVVAIVTMNSPYMARMSLYTMPLAILAISDISCHVFPINIRTLIKMLFVLIYAFFGYYEISHNSAMSSFSFFFS